jgi:hypothetical protein
MSKSKIAQRKEKKAVCPKCKSPYWKYLGRANSDMGEYWKKHGKHEFECMTCQNYWQEGKTENKYTELI